MQGRRTRPLPEPLSESGVYFPLTPTLSLGERGNLRQSVGESEDVGICASRALVLPLPKGEGRGEGEALCRQIYASLTGSDARPTLPLVGVTLPGRASRA
jgi:hypothetical protein